MAPWADLHVQLHFTEESLVLRTTVQVSLGLFCRLQLKTFMREMFQLWHYARIDDVKLNESAIVTEVFQYSINQLAL